MRIALTSGLLVLLLAASPPVLGQAASDTRQIKCGNHELTVFRMPTSGPHSVVAIHIRTAAEELANPSLFFTGSFLSLCKQDRFLLISDDAHFDVTKSFLMRGDGIRLAEFDLGWGPSSKASDDHNIFWVQTHEGDGIEETRLRVFDLNGKQLLDQRFRQKGAVVEVQSDGRSYRIEVTDPDLPG